MAHLLWKLGEAALKPRMAKSGGKLLPPLVSFEEAMRLREQVYAHGQQWPYEHIVPGPPKPPVGAEEFLKRKAEREAKKQKRKKEIEEAMAKMPQLIQEYKALRRLDWSQVSQVDKLTLSRTAIRQKYIHARLMKQS